MFTESSGHHVLTSTDLNVVSAFIERAHRLKPKQTINVFTADDQNLLGEVVNFNEQGMQLVLERVLPINHIAELVLVSFNVNGEKQLIKVYAELLWIKSQPDDMRPLAGFYLSSKNFKAKFRLGQLIKSNSLRSD
ncbi:PilZ domain-containing protein [Marinicella meishanensis]|uniref:PilZ domain-containing protein n=1 Tax=Marinicella meishanensis TaxID=2873263 RepID=UPI003D66D5CC